MKKLLLVLAIASFAACGDSSSTETTTDSTGMDNSGTMMAPGTDTVGTGAMGSDTSSMMGSDTSRMMADSTR